MPLPLELLDDVVPEATTVVGDVDAFIVYLEHGDAWRDWCTKVQVSIDYIIVNYGMITPEIIEQLLARP